MPIQLPNKGLGRQNLKDNRETGVENTYGPPTAYNPVYSNKQSLQESQNYRYTQPAISPIQTNHKDLTYQGLGSSHGYALNNKNAPSTNLQPEADYGAPPQQSPSYPFVSSTVSPSLHNDQAFSGSGVSSSYRRPEEKIPLLNRYHR